MSGSILTWVTNFHVLIVPAACLTTRRPVGANLKGKGINVIHTTSRLLAAFAAAIVLAAVPAAHAHRIDSVLGDADLASVPCAYSAAENMLTRANVQLGEIVLVTGASGGVGSAAVQLAVRRRATVIAVAAASKADAVMDLGASRVLAREADLAAVLGSECVDVVIDVVGGAQFPQLLEVLRRGGRYAREARSDDEGTEDLELSFHLNLLILSWFVFAVLELKIVFLSSEFDNFTF